VLDAGGADDGGVHPLRVQDPGEGNLGHRGVLLVGQFLDALVDFLAVALEVGVFPGVLVGLAAGGRVELLVGPREIPPRQRTPGNHADVLRLAVRQHLSLLLPVEQVVVVLHREKAVQPQILGGVLGLDELVGPHRTGAEIADLLPADRVIKRAHRRLDWGVVVPAVNLVEVEGVHSEPVEAGVQLLLDGLPGETAGVGVLVVHLEEHLRRNDHLLTSAFEGIAEDTLGFAQRVHVGGVEEVDAQVDGAVDDGVALLLFEHPLAPLRSAEAHTPETDAANLYARVAQRRVLHD